jgi:hypothetical protein
LRTSERAIALADAGIPRPRLKTKFGKESATSIISPIKRNKLKHRPKNNKGCLRFDSIRFIRFSLLPTLVHEVRKKVTADKVLKTPIVIKLQHENIERRACRALAIPATVENYIWQRNKGPRDTAFDAYSAKHFRNPPRKKEESYPVL